MKKQSGFTLIELLLVLAIIGIISAIAVPALLGQRARARDKGVMANTTSIVSDMVAQYDLQKDAATAITLASLDGALPQFASAKNPWDNSVAAYVESTNAAAGKPPAVGTVVGQVAIGYTAPAANSTGTIGATGLLNSKINGSTTFSSVAGID
jgi:type IV pilus assembly protein PilA